MAVAEQAVPQAYPLGQHPPPMLAAHVVHPLAHAPVSRVFTVVMPLPLGAITDSVLSPTTVILAVVGHDVTAQSRPV